MNKKTWSRVVTGAMAASMLATLIAVQAAPVSAAAAIKVTVDSVTVQFPDQKPIMDNNRVLIPTRFVAQQLGGKVDYNNSTKTVTIKQGDRLITLKVNSTKVTAGGKAIALDVPAKVVRGRTMVPLRFVSEAMGAYVDWNQARNLVAITTSAGTTQPTTPPATQTNGGFQFDPQFTAMGKELFVNNMVEANGEVTFTVPTGVNAYHREANAKKTDLIPGKQYSYSVGKGEGFLFFTFIDPSKVVPGAQKQAEQYTVSLDGSRWGFTNPNKAMVLVRDSKLKESYGTIEQVTALAQLLK